MKTVLNEELDYEIHTCTYLYEGVPFTGIAIEIGEEDTIIHETSFVNGHKNGICKIFYNSGKIKKEIMMKDDTSFGICKIWYENGQLKEESLEEWGITAKRKCWDEMGNLIEDYEISEKDNLYDLWLKQKKWWGSYSPL